MSYDTRRSVSDIIKCPIPVSVARSAVLCVSGQSRAQRCHIKPSIDLTGGIRSELKHPLRSELLSVPNTNTLLALNCALTHPLLLQ